MEHCDPHFLSIRSVTEPAKIPARDPVVWAISDGAAGNERQALALAAAMGVEAEVKRIAVRAPWRWFAPRLSQGAHLAMQPPPQAPWPDIAIGCGRQAALFTRALRQWSAARAFTVQILDPRVQSSHFDLVVAPQHDRVHGDNVLAMLGALNSVDAAWLAQGRADFAALLQLPQPRTALLVGGPRRGLRQDEAWLDAFIAALERLLERDGGSLMVALSRRTPAAWRERLHGAFHTGCVHFWGSAADGPNPYAGYLAYAERIVVTPDSVNMISEACATGVPVLSALPRAAHGKLVAFHAALQSQARLHDVGDATISTLTQIEPLRETAAIGAQVLCRYRERASTPLTPSPAA